MTSSATNSERRPSLRTASPGELDQYLDNKIDGIGALLGEGIVLSVPNQENVLESNSNDWGFEDQESIISEVTWMTYRAEMMKKALIMEYKRLKDANLKKEQKRLERLIRDAYRPTKNRGDGSQFSSSDVQNKLIHSRTVSTPDLHHMHVLAQRNNSMMPANEAKLDDIDEEVDNCSEMIHKQGELAVEFGLRAKQKKQVSGNEKDQANEIEDKNGSTDNSETNDDINKTKAIVQVDGQEKGKESYLDSIIELKLQLAQKQSEVDELCQVKAENVILTKENADLKQQITELQKLSYPKPKFKRDDSGATDPTQTSSITTNRPNSPRGDSGHRRSLSAMSRHLSWIDLRRSATFSPGAPVTESDSKEVSDQ